MTCIVSVLLFTLFSIIIDESVLLDVKHLLLEAKQKVPPVLAALQAENEGYLDLGGTPFFTILPFTQVCSMQYIIAYKHCFLSKTPWKLTEVCGVVSTQYCLSLL